MLGTLGGHCHYGVKRTGAGVLLFELGDLLQLEIGLAALH
jgi:hypothetical protein